MTYWTIIVHPTIKKTFESCLIYLQLKQESYKSPDQPRVKGQRSFAAYVRSIPEIPSLRQECELKTESSAACIAYLWSESRSYNLGSSQIPRPSREWREQMHRPIVKLIDTGL
jgi:hypothetical protein